MASSDSENIGMRHIIETTRNREKPRTYRAEGGQRLVWLKVPLMGRAGIYAHRSE